MQRKDTLPDVPAGVDPVFTEKQLAVWLGMSLPNLQRRRSNGSGPPFIQLSERRIGYRKSTVERWLESRTINRVGALATGQQPDSAALALPAKGEV